MSITVGWVSEEGAFLVEQNEEFIGDFETMEPAVEFALSVSAASDEYTYVEFLQPR